MSRVHQRRLAGRLGRRLEALQGGAIDAAYRQIAALWSAGMTTEQEAEVGQRFHWLAAAEAARGTPAEALRSRLPPRMAEGLRAALARQLGIAS